MSKPTMLKRPDKKCFKQLHLKPVEPVVAQPIPDVPEHFNYGVFFDDDFNYIQYLKPAPDSSHRTTFCITSIPEDEPTTTADPVESESIREPVVDDEPIPDGLYLESDIEDEPSSELEDNFIELAGGTKVCDANDAQVMVNDDIKDKHLKNVLHGDKVLMMERFLYGDHESDEEGENAVMDEEMDYSNCMTDVDRDFEKLMSHYKSRSKTENASMISGTSIMSEGLEYALNRDSRMLHRQCPKNSDLENLDDDVKLKTLEQLATIQLNAPESSSSDESDSDHVTTSIMSCEENPINQKPKFSQLKVPTKVKSAQKEHPDEGLRNSVTSLKPTPLAPDLLIRKKNESTEEKQLRKSLVKQHRMDRRRIRKLNQLNFRSEHDRQQRAESRVIGIS